MRVRGIGIWAAGLLAGLALIGDSDDTSTRSAGSIADLRFVAQCGASLAP